jgi:GntR family transcriptional repressor for pyruvate dehydrogenase complex
MDEQNNNVLFRPPHKVTIVESIVDQIVEQIQQGKLNPGDRLPSERQLIEMLGVSRSSVREALQGLMVMGMVESRPGQGTFVTNSRGRLMPNLDGLALAEHLQREMRLQLVEARRTIEPPIARLAAQRATPESIALLRQHLLEYQRDPFSLPATSEGRTAHSFIHLDIAEMTGNPFFVTVVDQLVHAIPATLRRREAIAVPSAESERIAEEEVAMHALIVEAIAGGDVEAAFQAMDDHLDYEHKLVMRLFPEELE